MTHSLSPFARVGLTLGSLLSVVFLYGCSSGADCSEKGCSHDIRVGLSIIGQPQVQPGIYEIDITTDSFANTLTCTIPSAGTVPCCEASTGTTTGCPVAWGSVVARIDVSIPGEPKTVSVNVRRDGTVIGSHQFSPSYTTRNPNGSDCPPKCRVAKAESFTL